jgi:hypothetical protein
MGGMGSGWQQPRKSVVEGCHAMVVVHFEDETVPAGRVTIKFVVGG